MQKTVLITGGAGFIGSNLVRYLVNETNHRIVNVDKLTYAGNMASNEDVADHPRYRFFEQDICNSKLITEIFEHVKPDIVMHLAAESHVDKSIDGPSDFIQTNVVGTLTMLEVARAFYQSLEEKKQRQFRFHHISTDEVYGDLDDDDSLFTESTPYDPSSPYSASKASSDHLVRAWHRTYGLPVVVTNCSNNYGPFHFPEKLIPLVILNALKGKPLPIYGDGQQIRDWLFVTDHAEALWTVAEKGALGETYNIGGCNEKTNLEVVTTICELLDKKCRNKLKAGLSSFKDLITFVEDRPGHDRRYAIDASKIESNLGWSPKETFETGMAKTVEWFLNNQQWCEKVVTDSTTTRQGRGK